MDSLIDIKVSPIGYADYIPLVEVYREFHQESHASRLINFDVDSLIAFLDDVIEDPDSVAIKCMLNDRVIGFYIGSISTKTISFSSTPVWFERGFYVRKEARGTRAALLMDEEICEWTRNKGVKPQLITIYHSNDNEAAYRFCEKRDMHEIGKIYERIL